MPLYFQKKSKERMKHREVLSLYDIQDMRGDWWSSIEEQAEIIMRAEAWKELGLSANSANNLGFFTITPMNCRNIEKKHFIQLQTLGARTWEYLQNLPEDSVVKWQEACGKWRKWAFSYAARNFKRVENFDKFDIKGRIGYKGKGV